MQLAASVTTISPDWSPTYCSGLGVTGVGEPGGVEHMTAIQALYAVATPIPADALPALGGRLVGRGRPAPAYSSPLVMVLAPVPAASVEPTRADRADKRQG